MKQRRLLAVAVVLVCAAGSFGPPLSTARAQNRNPPNTPPRTPASAPTVPPTAPTLPPIPAPNNVPTGVPTLPPASQPTTMPYPAYGTPAPGVTPSAPTAGVPQILTLDQSIAIGVARSPLLAAARADVALAQAGIALARAGLLPSLSGTVSVTRSHNGGTTVPSTGTIVTTTPGTGGVSGPTPVPGTGGGAGASPTPAPVTGGPAPRPSLAPGTSPLPGPSPVVNPGPVPTGIAGATLQRLVDARRDALQVASPAPTPVPGAGTTVTRSESDFTTSSLSINVRQLIYDGGRIRAEIQSANSTEIAQLETYRRELQTVAFNVATAYYNALAAQRTTQVALDTVRIDQVQENLVIAQVRAGTASRADIATVQLPTAQARVAVIRDQGNELSAQAAFANAMGLEANTLVRPADDTAVFQQAVITNVAVPTYEQALARAYALRPDYRSVQRQLEAASFSLRAARLGRFPTFSGIASAGDTSTDPNGGTFRGSASVGLQISIPLFDQGLTSAQVAQAQAQADVARANLDNTRLAVQLNVKQALVNLISARAALDQARAELNQANVVLASTQAQYRAGVTTLPLLLNAQVGLTTALSDQVTSVYSLRQAEQAFLYATGANDTGGLTAMEAAGATRSTGVQFVNPAGGGSGSRTPPAAPARPRKTHGTSARERGS